MIVADKIIRTSGRTLSVRITRGGGLVVRAPRFLSEEKINEFLEKKRPWIEAHLKAVSEAEQKYAFSLFDGCKIPFLGRDTTVRFLSGRTKYDEANAVIFVSPDEPEKRLISFFKQMAKRTLDDLCKRTSQTMKVVYQKLSVSSARTRWGSCSGKNALSFSFRVLFCPMPILEYVVIHELAHIRHKNHRKEFWDEVGRYCPDWKEKRKYLKTHAYYMEMF